MVSPGRPLCRLYADPGERIRDDPDFGLQTIVNNTPPAHRPAAFLAALAPGAVCILLFAFMTRSFFMDDAFIGFRYLDNLLTGQGLVFNTGERVEGITNVGWILFIAPLAAVAGIPVAAKICGVLLALSTLAMVGFVSLTLTRDKSVLLYKDMGVGFLNLPHPALSKLWKRVSPDYILEDSAVIETLIARSEGTERSFTVFGIRYQIIKRDNIGFHVDWVLCKKASSSPVLR
jgi:hypothetical protein